MKMKDRRHFIAHPQGWDSIWCCPLCPPHSWLQSLSPPIFCIPCAIPNRMEVQPPVSLLEQTVIFPHTVCIWIPFLNPINMSTIHFEQRQVMIGVFPLVEKTRGIGLGIGWECFLLCLIVVLIQQSTEYQCTLMPSSSSLSNLNRSPSPFHMVSVQTSTETRITWLLTTRLLGV